MCLALYDYNWLLTFTFKSLQSAALVITALFDSYDESKCGGDESMLSRITFRYFGHISDGKTFDFFLFFLFFCQSSPDCL